MKNVWKDRLFCTVFGCSISGVAVIYSWITTGSEHKPVVPKEIIAGADIETVIDSGIQALHKQAKLVVLSAELNSVATTTIKSTGMEAKQTDLIHAEAEYSLDLDGLDRENIVVNDNEITVTIPNDMLKIRMLPASDHQTYDNGSWLYSLDDTLRQRLTRRNEQELNRKNLVQAEAMSSIAKDNARLVVHNLFTLPLVSAGIQRRITINFN